MELLATRALTFDSARATSKFPIIIVSPIELILSQRTGLSDCLNVRVNINPINIY